MHAAGAKGAELEAFGHRIRQEIVAALVNGHAADIAGAVGVEVRPAVGVLHFVAEEFLRIESETEAEPESVAEVIIVGRVAAEAGKKQRPTDAEPEFAGLSPGGACAGENKGENRKPASPAPGA